MRSGVEVRLHPGDCQRLETVVGDRNSLQKHVWRAEIVLLTADGLGTNEIMRRTGKSKPCVWRRQERFMIEGVDGLLRDKTRPPGKAPISDAVAAAIIEKTLHETPPEATHWTVRDMSRVMGISVSTVQEIWRAHSLVPHRIRRFKLSNVAAEDNAPAAFSGDKLQDVVGLYVSPPAHAVVLSMDEKSQIQALDRTQPSLSMKKGRSGTMTHGDKCRGTTTLFAALNVLDGTVIGRNMKRHQHQEFLRFLNAIERDVPAGKVIHVILDNDSPHKHERVRQWLARHPRWTSRFTPTSASWLNAVEGFFTRLTKRHLKRGVFHSVVDLQAAINRFIDEHNKEPKPFAWTADPKEIIAAVNRGHQTLRTHH